MYLCGRRWNWNQNNFVDDLRLFLLFFGIFSSILIASCSTPSKPTIKVTLLPQMSGQQSSVIITSTTPQNSQQSKYSLEQPYQRLHTDSSGQTEKKIIALRDIRKEYVDIFQIEPMPAIRLTLYFQLGGTDLTTDSQAEIPRILEDVAQRPGGEVWVIGHTDTQGTLLTNDELSLRRAEFVASLLVRAGLKPKMMQITGRGQRDLIIPTANNVSEPRNRRVEIIVR